MKRMFQLMSIMALGASALLLPTQASAESFHLAYTSGNNQRHERHVRHVPATYDRPVVVHQRVVYQPVRMQHWGHANNGHHKGWRNHHRRERHERYAYHQYGW